MNARSCLAALLLVHSCAALAQPLDEEALADLTARPSIGLYKAYAEFKMARYDSARSIWQALADKEVAEAWFHLGILAEDGLGEARDARAALAHYLRGAEAGSTKAQYRLGLLYLEQRGSATGIKGAHVWLTEASRQKETASEAQSHLSTLCRHNPALKCERAAQGPTLGALLPPSARRSL